MKKGNTYQYVLAAIGAAIIAVLSLVSIPLPLVPIIGQTLAIGLVVTILGMKSGVLLYILLGAVGMPVFSGMSGGLGLLVGPTGGYIVGFLPTEIIMGLYLKKIWCLHAACDCGECNWYGNNISIWNYMVKNRS